MRLQVTATRRRAARRGISLRVRRRTSRVRHDARPGSDGARTADRARGDNATPARSSPASNRQSGVVSATTARTCRQQHPARARRTPARAAGSMRSRRRWRSISAPSQRAARCSARRAGSAPARETPRRRRVPPSPRVRRAGRAPAAEGARSRPSTSPEVVHRGGDVELACQQRGGVRGGEAGQEHRLLHPLAQKPGQRRQQRAIEAVDQPRAGRRGCGMRRLHAAGTRCCRRPRAGSPRIAAGRRRPPVSAAGRQERSNRIVPVRPSISAIACETAGWVTPRARAAAAMLPALAHGQEHLQPVQVEGQPCQHKRNLYHARLRTKLNTSAWIATATPSSGSCAKACAATRAGSQPGATPPPAASYDTIIVAAAATTRDRLLPRETLRRHSPHRRARARLGWRGRQSGGTPPSSARTTWFARQRTILRAGR